MKTTGSAEYQHFMSRNLFTAWVKSQIFSSISGIVVFDFVLEVQKSSGFYKWTLTPLRYHEEQI